MDGKYGILNINGSLAINTTFDNLRLKDELPNNAIASASLNGLYGLIDLSGNWVAGPIELDREPIATQYENLLIVSKNGKYGCINDMYEWVLQPEFDDLEEFYNWT